MNQNNISDILKPKSADEIRDSLKGLIFWKNIIDFELNDKSEKYFYDYDFIKQRKKEFNINFIKNLTTSSNEKRILYFLDAIKEKEKTFFENDDFSNSVLSRYNLILNTLSKDPYDKFLSLELTLEIIYDDCKKFINDKYKEQSKLFYKKIGCSL